MENPVKKEEESWGTKIKKVFDAKMLLIIGLIIMKAWDYGSDIFTKGAKVEFNNKVGEAFMEKMKDPEFANEVANSSIFMDAMLNSDKVDNFTEDAGMKIRDKIIDDVTKKDSLKINANARIAKELNIRDEDLTPLMISVFKAFKEGRLLTNEDIKDIKDIGYDRWERQRKRKIAKF